MNDMAVEEIVQKMMTVCKIKNSVNIGKKKTGPKGQNQEMDDISKRRNLYMEIFSEPNDILKQALKQNSDWLLFFLQDAFVECKNGDADPYIMQLSKAFSECDFAPSEAISYEIEKNLKKMVYSTSKIVKSSSSDGGVKAIQLWAFVIKILSMQILRSSGTTNLVCSVFLEGFKSTKALIVRQSFSSWRALIEAFAKDSNWSMSTITSCDKRLELVLRALRHKVIPDAGIEIFGTWWRLAESLCGRLPLLFEQVIHGLLRFCVGGETKYVLPSVDVSLMKEMLSKPMSTNCKLVSIMSKTLHLIKYSRTVTKVDLELIPKLYYLLNALLSNDGVFVSAFYLPEIVQLYSTFLVQCIRWISFNISSESSIARSLPGLWLSMSERISKVLSGIALQREMKLFMVQLYAWINENKHSENLANETITLLQSAGAFDGFETEYQKIKGLMQRQPDVAENKISSSLLSLMLLVDSTKTLFDDSTIRSLITEQVGVNSSSLPFFSSNSVNRDSLIKNIDGVDEIIQTKSEKINTVKSATESVLNAPSTPIASVVSTTPRSARLSGFANKPETPGILRKKDSPINVERKNLRVHFIPDEKDQDADVAFNKKSSESTTSRKRLFSLIKDDMLPAQTEAFANNTELELDNSPPEKTMALICSPIPRNKLNSTNSLRPSFTPFMPELVENEESIAQLCRNLVPNCTSSLIMHLHNKKVFTVGEFASMSEEEILSLPVRTANKIQKIREVMSRLYLGLAHVPFNIQSACTGDLSDFVVDIQPCCKKISENPAKNSLIVVPLEKERMYIEAKSVVTDISENIYELGNSGDKGISLKEQIRVCWNALKDKLAWVEDPSVIVDQKKTIEMLMAFSQCSNEISQKIHKSMFNT